MYNNMYGFNSVPSVDRIDAQINELKKIKEQMQKPVQPPTSLTQNFQLAPTTRETLKYAESIDEVQNDVAVGLYEDGILIPDTVRAVTIDAANDYESIAFKRKTRVCPRGTTNITVGAVGSVPTPNDPTTPIVTQIPIITNAIFNIARTNQ